MDIRRINQLPSRPKLGPTEALDGYLERLATANGLSTAYLHKLLLKALGDDATALAFLMVSPQRDALDGIARLGGADGSALRGATLTRYGDGLPLRLDGLDPRRHHTYRRIVMQGWFPPHGSQACPICLARDGIWRLEWRLPIITICRTHEVNLLTECPSCQMRFRMRRYSPMRPRVGPDQICGNPIGGQKHCDQSILTARPNQAADGTLEAAGVVARALAGQRIAMLGQPVDPRLFLAELRHLATLCLHLSSAANSDRGTADWSRLDEREKVSRTAQLRGPRWGISPPRSAAVRGRALAGAYAILCQPTAAAAGAQLASWLAPIAEVPNGPHCWLVNRTTRTPTTQRLITAALSDRHHVGRQLDQKRAHRTVAVSTIPQLLDMDLFREAFDGVLGGHESTGRLYVSLCLARSVTGVTTWSAAAEQLGLDPELGRRTARAASSRMHSTPEAFADLVTHTLSRLPRDRDFRDRESRVAALARDPRLWFDRWRASVSPARKRAALPYAITWMWCELAQGHLGTSPAWTAPPSARAKAGYREFRDRLAPAAQAGLRTSILDNTQA